MVRGGLEKNACEWQWESWDVYLNSRFLKGERTGEPEGLVSSKAAIPHPVSRGTGRLSEFLLNLSLSLLIIEV